MSSERNKVEYQRDWQRENNAKNMALWFADGETDSDASPGKKEPCFGVIPFHPAYLPVPTQLINR